MPLPSPLIVFDIETIPDIDTGKRLYPSLNDLSDEDAYQAITAMRQQEVGHQFMRLPLHKIVCLSFLWVEGDTLLLKSLALNSYKEEEIISTFFRAFSKEPQLVSWNGSGFDIPVILHRALHHKLSAPALFNSNSRPNYQNRYSEQHLDLMDKTALYNNGNRQKLDIVASLCGFAGKQNMDGSQVLPTVLAGDWQKLITYCESDVLNTWLVYLRWQLLTGVINAEEMAQWEKQTRSYLEQLVVNDNDDTANAQNAHGNEHGKSRHWEFLSGWSVSG